MNADIQKLCIMEWLICFIPSKPNISLKKDAIPLKRSIKKIQITLCEVQML